MKIINNLRARTPKPVLEHIILGVLTVFITMLFTTNTIAVFIAIIAVAAGKEVVFDGVLKLGTPSVLTGFSTFLAGAISYFFIMIILG